MHNSDTDFESFMKYLAESMKNFPNGEGYFTWKNEQISKWNNNPELGKWWLKKDEKEVKLNNDSCKCPFIYSDDMREKIENCKCGYYNGDQKIENSFIEQNKDKKDFNKLLDKKLKEFCTLKEPLPEYNQEWFPIEQNKAMRFNKGKLMWGLIPDIWEEELVKIFTKGATKYAPNNWMNSINTEDHTQFINDRYESIRRHLSAWRKGELFDQEVVKDAEHIETYHMGHVAWNALAIMLYDIKYNK